MNKIQVSPSPADFSSKLRVSTPIFLHRSQRLHFTAIPFKSVETCPFRQGRHKFESAGRKIFNEIFSSVNVYFTSGRMSALPERAKGPIFTGNTNWME